MPTSRVVLVLYAFAATINVMASARQLTSLDWATAPLLMPLLGILVVIAAQEAGRRPDAWLLGGLALATGTNLAVMAGDTVVAAVLLGAAHALYVVAFARPAAVRVWPALVLGGTLLIGYDLQLALGGPTLGQTLTYAVAQALIVVPPAFRTRAVTPAI
jgi:hypothetical protein